MGALRESNEKKETLDRLSNTKDLKNALELMVDLKGHTFLEEEVVTKYSKKTGKPLEYSWKPYEKFETNINSNQRFFIYSIYILYVLCSNVDLLWVVHI